MKSWKVNLAILILIVIVTAFTAAFVYPAKWGAKYSPWRMGLDIVGGSALVYQVDLSGINQKDYSAVVAGLRDVISKRVNLYGVAEPRVSIAQKGNTYQLIVELAGVKDLGDAVKQIGAVPVLDFREVQQDGKNITFPPTPLTGRYVTNAALGFDELNKPIFTFTLNDEGAKIFEELTSRNVNKPICIFVDNAPIFPNDINGSCPRVNEVISGGKAQISGSGITVDVAKQLVDRFNAGALAAPIKLINQRTVSASAAADALHKILIAGAVGMALVLLFMLLSYRTLGIFASLALIIYTILSLGIFKMAIPGGFTLTLSGIAGFILSIGMAVDANILIFERSREEIKKGLSWHAAIEEGFRRAWPSIRDSNMSTIITSTILYFLTSDFVRGFALTLGLGVLVSMFSAIFVTRTMLEVFLKK
jgi:preprotein translocase subunit SecD